MIQNYNIWRWVTDANKLHKNVHADNPNEQVPPVLMENRKLPPFQIIRPTASNSPITKFELTRLENGDVIDVLTTITDPTKGNLYIQQGGEIESMDTASIVVQSSGDNKSGWGWSIGTPFTKFRYLSVTVYADDPTSIPTLWQARLLDGYGGTVLVTSTEVKQVIRQKENYDVVFDFGSVYDNQTSPDNLYLEIKSNGVWSPVGKEPYLGAGETQTWKVSGAGIYDWPDADADADTYAARVVGWQYGGNFDIIEYNGNDIGKYLQLGIYEAEMSDGQYTWYSEKVGVRNIFKNKIKLSWWHNKPISLPVGIMRYVNSFKNTHIMESLISRPEYLEDEAATDVEGQKHPQRQTSYVKRNFVTYISVFMYDALSIVWQHHNILLETDCETYTINELSITPLSWTPGGNMVQVRIEFIANETITTFGSGAEDLYIEQSVLDMAFPATACNIIDCLKFDYETDEQIDLADVGTYTSKYNKYVLVRNTTPDPDTYSLYYWNGTTLSGYALTTYDVIKSVITGVTTFWYWYGGELVTTSEILTITDNGGNKRNVKGRTFKYAIVQIEYEVPGPTSLYSIFVDGQEFIDNGLDFDAPINRFRLHATGKDCVFTSSDWINNV